MTNNEIHEFIERMEEIGDIWTVDQVKDVYGNSSLEAALADRKTAVGTFFNIIGKILNSK